ncbi:MAG: hypothetical protein IIB15_03585, partial [Chloroflexi bacterium]|nr:hypothetical protein [Chloroflexota bacterium]
MQKLAEQVSEIPQNEGESKVLSLQEAVQRNVDHGMTLLFANPAAAILYQLIREFHGK